MYPLYSCRSRLFIPKCLCTRIFVGRRSARVMHLIKMRRCHHKSNVKNPHWSISRTHNQLSAPRRARYKVKSFLLIEREKERIARGERRAANCWPLVLHGNALSWCCGINNINRPFLVCFGTAQTSFLHCCGCLYRFL
jgi:hypothetical protein